MKNSAKQVQSWFAHHVQDSGKTYTLDKHQAAIVSDSHQHTIVTARAGSGKTRTIVAKITYLLAHEKISPEEIIVFAFNKKAKTEINERLTNIAVDGKILFTKTPNIATTFHAFAYKIIKANSSINLISESQENHILTSILKYLIKTKPDAKLIDTAKQFITRAEQQFFLDYSDLQGIINSLAEPKLAKLLLQTLKLYHQRLSQANLINFNQMVANASQTMPHSYPYKYIFIDEYQDFSLLFLTLVKSLITKCNNPHLLVVGDDWQAINRFAGSNVEYFTNFANYFPTDCKKLFIPTNYRSGKLIVKNANFFMLNAMHDPAGCGAKNRAKSQIFLCDAQKIPFNYQKNSALIAKLSQNHDSPPLILCQYLAAVLAIIRRHPGQTIKLLLRNNNFSCQNYTLDFFTTVVKSLVEAPEHISSSTVHRSKGLESDVVILLEVDAEKFPAKPKDSNLFSIFGDNPKNQLEDEHRLFYVALTRAKESLYILTKSTTNIRQKYNFLNYLNEDFLTDLILPT